MCVCVWVYVGVCVCGGGRSTNECVGYLFRMISPLKIRATFFPPDFVFPVVTTVVSNVGFGEGRQKSGRGGRC